MITMPESEYAELHGIGAGMCLVCGAIDCDGCIEPDATKLLCHACGARKVCGIETALLTGAIEFTE